MSLEERWYEALKLACANQLKYADILVRWDGIPRPGLDRLIVRGRQVYYNPDLPAAVLAAELIHLTHHKVQRHQERLDPQRYPNAKLRRIAACLETVWALDDDIRRDGLQWAPGTDLREQYPLPQRMTCEEIYDYLDRTLSEQEKQEDGQEQEGAEGQSGEGQGSPSAGGGVRPAQGKPGQGQPGQGQPGAGQPGPGQPGQGMDASATTADDPGQTALPDPGQIGDGICRLEDYQFEKDLDGEGAEGQGEGEGDGQGEGQDGRQPGEGGQAGSEAADILHEPDPARRRVLMWLKVRNKLMAGNSQQDYSHRPRPSPVSPPDLSIPRLQKKPQRIGILLDVSGSVNNNMLKVFIEVAHTLHMRERNIIVATGDVKVQEVGGLEILRRIKGRGGTAFDKVIPEAYQRMRRPERMLIITDGETKWPPRVPTRNTIILIINEKPIHLEGGWRGQYKMPEALLSHVVWVRLSDLDGPATPLLGKPTTPKPRGEMGLSL